MASGRSAASSLGGLGALFFLGTLGAIAFYVQRQSAPEDQDLVRKAATVVTEVAPEEQPPTLPWEDRLALSAAQLVRFDAAPAEVVPAAGPARTPPGAERADGKAGPSAPGPADKGEAPVDPKRSRFVQDLNDGHRILLTLDPVLQDAALTIFRNREVPYAGAVVIDLRDSSVLTLAGHSSMDPQVDPVEVVATAWAPAASTFKLVTAAALLDSGAATPTSRACFHGGLHGIKDDELRDDPSRDTRCETLSAAIAHSYNLVIGKLALRHLDQAKLADVARMFQFETDIPFEFNVERSPAHIPSDPIERAKVAAGFWNVDLSPMHAAVIASIFARGGLYQPPHLIDQVIAPDGTDVTPQRTSPRRVIGRDIAQAIGVMMRDTTSVGTARASFRDRQGNDYVRGAKVAGKTGSLTGKKSPALNYNWFVGYAPADRPEIAFAVVLANTPKWRIKAHYAARRLVQIYLERRAAITQYRDAKLTPAGLILPRRDATGALVQAKPATAKASTDAKADPTAKPDAKALPAPPPPGNAQPPPPEDPEPALPPVPGALPPPP